MTRVYAFGPFLEASRTRFLEYNYATKLRKSVGTIPHKPVGEAPYAGKGLSIMLVAFSDLIVLRTSFVHLLEGNKNINQHPAAAFSPSPKPRVLAKKKPLEGAGRTLHTQEPRQASFTAFSISTFFATRKSVVARTCRSCQGTVTVLWLGQFRESMTLPNEPS